MHKNATKCNKTLSKWCINKHGASKIIDTFETYQIAKPSQCLSLLSQSQATNCTAAQNERTAPFPTGSSLNVLPAHPASAVHRLSPCSCRVASSDVALWPPACPAGLPRRGLAMAIRGRLAPLGLPSPFADILQFWWLLCGSSSISVRLLPYSADISIQGAKKQRHNFWILIIHWTLAELNLDRHCVHEYYWFHML
jgi:hypothetical protein